MAVYVDEAKRRPEYKRFGARALWCHLLADTSEELYDMAEKLGLRDSWIQFPGTAKEHYDIVNKNRVRAVRQFLAKEITTRQMIEIIQHKRVRGF